MLTSVYYYAYYRPYILHNLPKIGEGRRGAKTEIQPDPATQETFVLNNSLKRDIIRYASGLSGTVNELRETSKNLLKGVFNFKNTVSQEGFEIAKANIRDGLNDFVSAYNRNLDFVKNSSNNGAYKTFTDDLSYDVSISATALAKYGVDVSDDDYLSFDPTFTQKLSGRELNDANKANYALFKNIYGSAGDFLTMPLAEHLKFKNLGYYYNYKLGTIEKDSFKLIRSGMIVDKVV